MVHFLQFFSFGNSLVVGVRGSMRKMKVSVPLCTVKLTQQKKKREKKKKMRLLLFLGKATMELAVAPLLLDELSRGELLFTMAMEPPSGVEN